MKCSECNNEAVIYLSYSQKFLCSKHLSRLVEKRVGASIREYGMIEGRKRIGVAVSGGKDSLTMLYLLHKLLGKDRRLKLIAITVDEGIKGYRDVSIRNARRLAKSLGIEHHIYKFTDYAIPMDRLMKHKKTDPCSYCGVFRRWILNKAAGELKLDALAIGHNLDDIIQTFLMNMMRNEPLRIARFTPNGGIIESEAFVSRIRPLFSIPEREVMAYALCNNIDFHNGECPYAAYALRNPVREFLNNMEEKYPGVKFRVLNSYLSVLKNMKVPENLTTRTCITCGGPSSTEQCKRCILLDKLKKQMGH